LNFKLWKWKTRSLITWSKRNRKCNKCLK
jgi:hypothetical protein